MSDKPKRVQPHPDVEVHVIVLKPELLVNYGFVDNGYGLFVWYNSVGKGVIECQTAHSRRVRARRLNVLTFAFGKPAFSWNIFWLLTRLRDDGVIQIEATTKADRIRQKIASLESQLDEAYAELDKEGDK